MKNHSDDVFVVLHFGLVVNLHLRQTYEYICYSIRIEYSRGKVWEKVCSTLWSLCFTSQQDASVVRRWGDKKSWRVCSNRALLAKADWSTCVIEISYHRHFKYNVQVEWIFSSCGLFVQNSIQTNLLLARSFWIHNAMNTSWKPIWMLLFKYISMIQALQPHYLYRLNWITKFRFKFCLFFFLFCFVLFLLSLCVDVYRKQISIGAGIGTVFGSLIIGYARNPSLKQQLFSYAILGFALSEAMGLFCLMMSFLLLFAF